MKKVLFLKNAVVLTATSLIIRFIGIMFKIWLSRTIGAEGIGLYQLIFSVYMLASTFASSGIVTAVTRLVADEAALGSHSGIIKILRRCLSLALIISAVSSALLIFNADFIAGRLLGDMRAAPSVKILSAILPFMGISSVLRGYFIAMRKASPPAFSQLFEQLIRIAVVFFLIKKYLPMGLTATAAAVFFADIIAHSAASLLLFLLYMRDKKQLYRLSGRELPPFGILKSVLRISTPITAGRYLNTALRTVENILVPRGLQKNSAGSGALAQFGTIKGMALPVLFFPSSLLSSLSTMLIPEISEASACGRNGLVKSAVERIIQLTSIISFLFSAVFLTSGKLIGDLFFENGNVGYLLCILSPIVPLMYLDSVCDGILKGLDQQSFCFFTGLIDSGLRIILIPAVLPRFGMNGFIGIMYFSNLLTCLLNVGRLIKISKAEINITGWILFPIAAALSITLAVSRILIVFRLTELLYIILLCAFCFPMYIIALLALGSISSDNIRDVLPGKRK